MTVEDVKKDPRCTEILLINMRCNKWERVVKTRAGNFQPLNANDNVIGLDAEQTGDGHD